ncbi:hypothetical protein TRAPUB_1364 [Trametes pubescens]|uniref:Uncharacterized protein n=1 Tax=Trametes pubescens TaxID=154538 RepID=A0A1M2VJP6_TRAPU|nr:hypothetical protein TRAPUB_1364 [Trametes pubescens]
MAGGPIPGRTFSRHWQTAVDRPSYTLGAWLGRTGNHHDGDWAVLCAGASGSQITTSFQELRYVAPRQDSPSEALPEPPYLVDYDDDYFDEKMDLAKLVDVPESDRDEMGVDFVLAMDGTRWKRYRFSCVPAMDQTIVAHQRINIRGGPGPRVAQLVPSSFEVEYNNFGMALQHGYLTETTVTMAAHASESANPREPLWFFVLQFDDSNQGTVRPLSVPCGFWSAEENPASIPADIVLDPTLQFERIGRDSVAPLSTWTQVLEDLSFTIQTKMHTYVLGLGDDEILVLRELQKHRGFTSNAYISDECPS